MTGPAEATLNEILSVCDDDCQKAARDTSIYGVSGLLGLNFSTLGSLEKLQAWGVV